MKPEVKAKWIEDLTSGKFLQGKTLLNHNNRNFCCLGVLAMQFADEWRECRMDTCLSPFRAGVLLAGGTPYDPSNYLSTNFLKEIGLSDVLQRTLATRNDNGDTFAAIAAYIEEKVTND